MRISTLLQPALPIKSCRDGIDAPGLLVRIAIFFARIGVSAMLLYLCIAVLLGLGLTYDNLSTLTDLQLGSTDGLWQILALCATFLAAAWCWRTARRDRPYPVLPFLIGLLMVGTGIRGLLAVYVDSQWSTDYLRYWQHAVAMADGGVLSVGDLYDQRALLIAYPVVRLFGPDAQLAMKLVNVALLLIVQLLGYDMMRLARSHQAAQSMSILLLAAPMPAYVALIPSHDLWGLLFLAIAIWAATRAAYLTNSTTTRTWPRVVCLSLVCGIATYCLELQRTTGTLFALALCLAAITSWVMRKVPHDQSDPIPRNTALLVVALTCMAMQPVMTRIGTGMGIHPAALLTAEPMHKMKLAAHAGAMGTATSDWYARFRDRFAIKATQDTATASEFARSLALSTWIIQPDGKLLHAAAHMPRMFDLGYPSDWDTALRRPTQISAATRGVLIFYAGAFGIAFGLMLVIALASSVLSQRTLPPPVLISVLMLAVLSFLLLVLFENKAPNIFPIWLAGSMFIAWFAAGSRPVPRSEKVDATAGALILVATLAAVVIASVTLWAIARMAYGENDGRVLDDWNLALHQSIAPPPDWEEELRAVPPRAFEEPFYENEKRGFVMRAAHTDGARIHKYSGSLLTVLEFPATLALGDTLAMTRKICGAGEARSLEFFVFSELRRKDVNEAFSLDVAIDGAKVRHIPIPLQGGSMHFVNIPYAINDLECHEVSMTLTANVAHRAESWRRVSRTEIWFPRLTRSSAPD